MKIEKNKIVFASVLTLILAFLISYSLMIMDEGEEDNMNLKQTTVPQLAGEQKEYDSKLDAINDLKEVRETNAPSIYDEKLIDSLGNYDPHLPEKEKERIVDSIYAAGRIRYSEKTTPRVGRNKVTNNEPMEIDSTEYINDRKLKAKEMGLEHQLFFASDPLKNDSSIPGTPETIIYAVVDGDQVVQVNSRLRMRLTKTTTINGKEIPEHTLVFGFIKFRPNRALIEIENIGHQPTNLKAYDLQDGSEGIYVENSFREEATNEVLDDIIEDINIPSVPQLSGVTKVLRRKNRNIKVTVLNNYKLILKLKP